MRSDDEQTAAGFQQPVELFHRSNHVRHVFDEVDGTNFAKRAVLERKREVVQIRNHVGIGVYVPIYSDCARIFIDPAADVKYRAARMISR